jgi:hypothetical protein
MSWYRAPSWHLQPDITSCRNVAVWNLRSCSYWAPSLTRGRVSNLQCNHSIFRAAQNPKPYFTVSSETPEVRWGEVSWCEVTLRLTVSQSVSMSWNRVPLWDLRPDIISCRNVAVWRLRSCFCGVPSLTRGRVCSSQCNHSMVRVAQNPEQYFPVSSVTPEVRWGEVTLRLTVSQSVCLGIEYTCGTCDQILLRVGMLLSEICGLVSVGRPLWREDGFPICGVISQWSESLRTRNHNLLSRLRLPQPRAPVSRIYIPQEQGGPIVPPGTGFPLRRLLRFASDELQGYGGGI